MKEVKKKKLNSKLILIIIIILVALFLIFLKQIGFALGYLAGSIYKLFVK